MKKTKIGPYQETRVKTENVFLNRVLSFILTSFDLIRSILIRITFSIHITITVACVAFLKNDLWYLVNLVGIAFIGKSFCYEIFFSSYKLCLYIGIEWFFCALKNGGQDQPWLGYFLSVFFYMIELYKYSNIEIKRFSKSFFLYIATVIPPTWLLELENIRLKLKAFESSAKTSKAPVNSSTLLNQIEHLSLSTTFPKSNISTLLNQTNNYYDYDSIDSIPVKIPDLPDDFKVELVYCLNI